MAKSWATIVEIKNNYDSLNRMLKFIKDNAVYVGVPDATLEREKEHNEVTNAELLFIHTNGSQPKHIPARPVIEPAIENSLDSIFSLLKKAAQLASEGNGSEAYRTLGLVGMKAQKVCRLWFVSPLNNWPPNSPAVQRRKRRKKSTDPKPLIDTGELRKSITYFIETKGVRKYDDKRGGID